jgi:4-alpha-glucanotransferase
MATLAGFWRGQDIEDRARVGLIESRDAKATAHADRERDKEALVALLKREGTLHTDGSASGGAERETPEPNELELRAAVHEFLCKTPAALVGLALDDLAGERDAVNVPGVGPDKHSSWTRKMSMTLEEMRASADVRSVLRCGDRSAARE